MCPPFTQTTAFKSVMPLIDLLMSSWSWIPQQCAFLWLKTLSSRSRFMIRLTELWDMPVTFWILWGLWLVSGLFPWLHFSSEMCEIFCCIRTDRGHPLPTFHSTEPILSIFRKRLLTKLMTPFFWQNSKQIPLAPHPFSCLRSLIKRFSSYVNGVFRKERYVIMTQHCAFAKAGQFRCVEGTDTKINLHSQNWLLYDLQLFVCLLGV